MFYLGQRAINKSPMDGNGPSIIKSNPTLINWYGSLGLDYEEQMVYWGSGTYISALRRCDYFGQNEVQITQERSSVEKVVIFRDHIITFEALFLESYVARYDKRTAGDFVRIHGMTGNTKLTIQVFNADVRSKGKYFYYYKYIDYIWSTGLKNWLSDNRDSNGLELIPNPPTSESKSY